MPRIRPIEGTRVSLTLNSALGAEILHSAQVKVALDAVVAHIAGIANQTCPVGSEDEHLPPGHEPEALKKSQEHGSFDSPRGLIGVITYHAWWAHMVHNGTVHSHPNPWLLNAALQVLVGSHVR